MSSLLALLVSFALGVDGSGPPTEYVGQVACSECWFEAGDRIAVPYGTPADLACAARCAGTGIPPALAIRSADGFELILLEGGGEWNDWMGRFARLRGVPEQRDEQRFLRVESREILEGNPWATTAPDQELPVELTWTDLAGHEQSLEAFRGRIVVLNFWATWCAPCRKELPDLVRIQNRFGMHGVQVVGAAADAPTEAAAVAEFARRYKINFPVLLGATTEQMQALGVGVTLPATVVIDRQGRVVERLPGVFEPPQLAARLERLVEFPKATGDAQDAALRAAAEEPHDHDEKAHGHGHPPHGTTGASLVPS